MQSNLTLLILTTALIKYSLHPSYQICWPNAPKGGPTPPTTICLSQGQATSIPTSHSFLINLSQQPDIAALLQTNLSQHQTNLIHHDLDNLDDQNNLINHLLTSNPLTISTHNTRIISDTTKYIQLLETLDLHKVDICGVTETGHSIGQKYKFPNHPEYSAF